MAEIQMSHLRTFCLGIVASCAFVTFAQAQQAPPAAPTITMKMLKPDVWEGVGDGGNSTIIIGKTGVIVVDAKQTNAGAKELLAQIAKITPKPVTTVIITHSDGDHLNGLVAYPPGIKIIAHENNKKEQQAALSAGGRGAPPADHLPNQVIAKNRETLKIEGVRIELLHWAPAHTSGDLVVFLPAEKIVFTGDIIATQMPDALIHLEKHGSSEGWITTTKGMVALNADQYVPGHGNVQTKDDIQQRLAKVEAKRKQIQELAAQGKSLEEIRAAVGDPPPQPNARFASFTEVVYRETTNKGSED